MIIIRDGMVYVQKRDVAFLFGESTGVALPPEVATFLRGDGQTFSDDDFEFIGYSNQKVCDFLKSQAWLVDFEAVSHWTKYEVQELLDKKSARARRLLAAVIESGPDTEEALSGNRLRHHLRETLELRTTLYTISQLEEFMKAHPFRLFTRWRSRLTWELPD